MNSLAPTSKQLGTVERFLLSLRAAVFYLLMVIALLPVACILTPLGIYFLLFGATG